MSDIHPRQLRPRAVAVVSECANPWLAAALFLLLVLLIAPQVRAQPRIGLSASKDIYVDNISVPFDTDFQVYAMVFGSEPGTAMNQAVSSLPWVIHQVCCGAVVEILHIEFNPELEHTGHPLGGTVSSVETCIDQDSIWLATLTVRLTTEQEGYVLWASGPFGPILDCEGGVPFFMNMPLTIALDGEPTPNQTSQWGQVKAMYR